MEEQDFGSYLAYERKQAGHTLRRLSSLSCYAPSTLSRWENGKTVPARQDVEELDRVFNAQGRLVSVWETVTSGGLPPWMRSSGALEEKAVAVDVVSVSVVPGLLQSLGYAKAVFRSGHPAAPQSEIDRLAQLRVSRYEALIHRNDPLVAAVFPMYSLRHLPEDVLRDQVKHLLGHLSRGRLMIHLIPETTPILSMSSSVQMYRLKDGATVAASDHARGNVLLERAEDAEAVGSLIRDLIGLAHPRSESAALLEGLLSDKGFPQELIQ